MYTIQQARCMLHARIAYSRMLSQHAPPWSFHTYPANRVVSVPTILLVELRVDADSPLQCVAAIRATTDHPTEVGSDGQ